MSKPVGGRGIKAPYETTHIRVPVALKAKFQKEVDGYKELVVSGKLNPDQVEDLKSKMDTSVMSFSEALIEAKKLLTQKRSVKETIAKLLTGMYGVKVDPKDL